MGINLDSLRERLAEAEEWPCRYTFKFIVPVAKDPDARALLPGAEFEARPSKGGKYVGLTARVIMDTPDAVVSVYTRAAHIEGLIAL